MTARPITAHQPVPAHARQIAAHLSALFDKDVEIVHRLNDAHHRLHHANQRLRYAPAPDAVQQIHSQIHSAFCVYQHATEQRRQLAVDIGELSHQLTHALAGAGWSRDEARRANVHQLAAPNP